MAKSYGMDQGQNSNLGESKWDLESLRFAIDQHAIVSIADVKGNITFANDKFCEITGFRRGELLGQNHRILNSGEHPKEMFDEMWRTIARGKVWDGVIKNQKKDGGYYWVSSSIIPFLNKQGKPFQYFSIRTDITERVNLLQEMKPYSQLKAVGQLASGIAHEINTPIQYVGDNLRFVRDSLESFVIVLAAYRLLLDASSNIADLAEIRGSVASAVEDEDLEYLFEELPQAIEEAQEGTERVRKIVLAMKEFSHPSSREKTEVDINRALSTTIAVSRSEWKDVADVETLFDPGLPIIAAFPGDLNQVFLNLIVNAAQAIAEKDLDEKGTIKVSTTRDGPSVEIRISDTGNGMSTEITDHIFDPFFTTKEVGMGTGQGLSIAYDIITNKHEGSVSFETVPGQGTTFVVRLPINVGKSA